MMINYPGLSKLKTKPIVYEDVLPADSAKTLEHLKELSSKRKAVEESVNGNSSVTAAISREMSGGFTSRYEQDIQKLECYLPLLENLVQSINTYAVNEKITGHIRNLHIRWSTPFTPTSIFQGLDFSTVDNMHFELGMTLFLYAGLLRDRAFQVLSSSDLVLSATLLRKAAGVYKHIADTILVKLHLHYHAQVETAPSLCSIISLLCLADAQAVAARKAEEKGSSGGILAKLHFGVKDILVEAIHILQSQSKKIRITSRFSEYLLTCKMLHELTSYKYLVQELKTDDKHGIAIGVLRYALANAKKTAPREESWRSVCKQMIDEATTLLKKYERENEFVWYEKIPSRDDLPSPQAVRIANLIPYEPDKMKKKLNFKF